MTHAKLGINTNQNDSESIFHSVRVRFNAFLSLIEEIDQKSSTNKLMIIYISEYIVIDCVIN